MAYANSTISSKWLFEICCGRIWGKLSSNQCRTLMRIIGCIDCTHLKKHRGSRSIENHKGLSELVERFSQTWKCEPKVRIKISIKTPNCATSKIQSTLRSKQFKNTTLLCGSLLVTRVLLVLKVKIIIGKLFWSLTNVVKIWIHNSWEPRSRYQPLDQRRCLIQWSVLRALQRLSCTENLAWLVHV